jgi:hypothetical protein
MSRRPKAEEDEVNLIENSEFTPDLQRLAEICIKLFLEPKNHFSGRKLTLSELLTDDNVNIVLRMPFDDETFLFIHNRCLSKIKPAKGYRDSTVPWNVHYLLGLLDDLKSLQLPKRFQPGLLMLYFKYCKGFEIKQLPALITS